MEVTKIVIIIYTGLICGTLGNWSEFQEAVSSKKITFKKALL